MARSSGRVGYDKQQTRSLCFKSAAIVLESVNFEFPPQRRADAFDGSTGSSGAERLKNASDAKLTGISAGFWPPNCSI
jgi:hypothetical protein